MPNVKVPLDLAQALLDYLQQKPYGEVAGLVQAMASLPVDDGKMTTGDAKHSVVEETLSQAASSDK